MIFDAEVQALIDACHSDPFEVLGMHADAQGMLWVRVLLPGAEQQVIVLNAGSGRALMALRLRHAGGLFEGSIPRRRKLFDYRLQVRWHNDPESAVNIYADV